MLLGLAGVYLALLAASHVWRLLHPAPPPALPANRQVVMVPAVRGDRGVGPPIRLAYREWAAGSGTGEPAPPEPAGGAVTPVGRGGAGSAAATTARAPADTDRPATSSGAVEDDLPIVLLHGSPGSARDFERMGPVLAQHRRVLAPDLPGFGYSEHDVPDYSVRAHARYTLEMLDALGIRRFHVLGFSMGGGVVLEMWQQAPDRVASITMLSAIGVEELELFGEHHLNHLLHRLQVWLVVGLIEGFPHFGALDHFPLSYAYTRNFYDSDQSRLRGILDSYAGPMLILHGDQDFLVPKEAAYEHRRIVPQSQLVMLPESHFMVFTEGDDLARRWIEPFLEQVDSGRALDRAHALPDRVAAEQAQFDRKVLPPFMGPALLLALVMLALSTLVSEDLTCIGAGLLVALGRIGFIPATIACYVGIVFGDFLLYLTGRFLGRPALRYPPLKWWLKPQALEDASAWLRRRGAAVIFLCRFVPGSRLPTSVAAGVLHTPWLPFLGYFAIAAVPWTPLLVWASAHLGAAALPMIERSKLWFLVGVLLLGLMMFLVQKLLLPSLSRRGRRLLRGRWHKWLYWEFWPPWLFYPPLVLYVLWLGLRRRSLTLFAAVNPAMPNGGFVGESKSAILRQFAPGVVPTWRAVHVQNATELEIEVERFIRDEGLDGPVVVKPDVGERGRAVAVLRRPGDADRYVERFHPQSRMLILQRYVGGVEVGLFWVKGPEDEHGEVLSITEKRPPVLRGDGKRSLERLIVDDDRAVVLYQKYLAEHPDARTRVPADGEEVKLVEIGAHARGTIFLDARELATPELTAAVARIVEGIPGFDFGRFDFKAESFEAIARGEGLQVIEVNGVTSECTHIYDRHTKLLAAYRTLFAQWRRAFEVGAQRRRQGHRPPGVVALARAVWRAWRGLAPVEAPQTPE